MRNINITPTLVTIFVFNPINVYIGMARTRISVMTVKMAVEMEKDPALMLCSIVKVLSQYAATGDV